MIDEMQQDEWQAKKSVLADIEKFKKIFKELRIQLAVRDEEILAKEKDLRTFRNRCWWDAKPCIYYSEIRGFQDARYHCNGCCHVDGKRFATILQQDLPEFTAHISVDLEAVEEAAEELVADKEEEIWQDVHEELLSYLTEFE